MGTAATTVVADATGHAEQGMQGRPGLAVRPEALGDHAEGQRMGQHLVIPGEIADRQQLDAGVLLYLPVGGAQLPADGPQAGLVQLALPERFLGFFQFAIASDAWEAESVGQGHGCSSSRKVDGGILGRLMP